MTVAIDTLIGLGVAAAMVTVFGRFEVGVATSKRITRMAIYVGVGTALSIVVGRPWSLIWTLGALTPGVAVHTLWCVRHHINPLTSEPREEYLRLRGWSER